MPTPTRDELVDLIAVKIPYVTKEIGYYTAMRILQHLEENGVCLVPIAYNPEWYQDSPYVGIRVPDSSPFVPKAKSQPTAEPLIGFDAGDGSSD
jgi:hypothetical protein